MTGIRWAVAAVAIAVGVATMDTTAPAQGKPANYQVTIIGDSYTGGSAEGGNNSAGWPALAAQLLEQHNVDMNEQVLAEGGSGYVHRGTSGGTFGDKVADVRPDDDLVVFFGSRNDGDDNPLETVANARSAWLQVEQRAPHAKILVIGPAWSNTNQPLSLLQTRDLMRASAAASGIEFLDPLGDEWFADTPQLIGSDGVHPNDNGHQFMASKIAPVICEELSGESIRG